MGPFKGTPSYVGLVLFFGLMRTIFINYGWAVALAPIPRGGLLSLWILLQFTSRLGLDDIQIYGDSRVVIDWAKNIHGINIIILSTWLKKTREMINCFQNILFSHIFREQNMQVDLLSKSAVLAPDGYFFFEFSFDGSLASKDIFQTIFD